MSTTKNSLWTKQIRHQGKVYSKSADTLLSFAPLLGSCVKHSSSIPLPAASVSGGLHCPEWGLSLHRSLLSWYYGWGFLTHQAILLMTHHRYLLSAHKLAWLLLTPVLNRCIFMFALWELFTDPVSERLHYSQLLFVSQTDPPGPSGAKKQKGNKQLVLSL